MQYGSAAMNSRADFGDETSRPMPLWWKVAVFLSIFLFFSSGCVLAVLVVWINLGAEPPESLYLWRKFIEGLYILLLTLVEVLIIYYLHCRKKLSSVRIILCVAIFCQVCLALASCFLLI